MITLVLSVVLASNASGKQVVRAQQGTTVPSAQSIPASGYWPFAGPGCKKTGTALGAHSEPVHSQRARGAYCNTSAAGDAPSVLLCPVNSACVEADGILGPNPTRTTGVAAPEDLSNAAHTKSAGVTVATRDASCPTFNDHRMDKITNGSAGLAGFYETVSGAQSVVGWSAYLSAPSGSVETLVQADCPSGTLATACDCFRSDGVACSATPTGRDCPVTTAIGTSLVRVSVTATCSASGSPTYSSIGIPAAQSLCVSGLSYTSTGRATEIMSSMWPLASAAPSWCVVSDVSLDGRTKWTGINGTVMAAGPDTGPNSMRVRLTASGTLVFDVYDATSTAKTLTVTHNFANGSGHVLGACNVEGTLSVWDGTAKMEGTVTGTGLGMWSAAPISLYLGNGSVAETEAQVKLRNFRVCPVSTPAQCKAGNSRSRGFTGQERYVWAGTPKEYRTHSSSTIGLPFDWAIDPVGPTSIRRASNGPGVSGWTFETLNIVDPGGYFPGRQFRDVSTLLDRATGKFWYAVNSIGTTATGWNTDRLAIWTSDDANTITFNDWIVFPTTVSHFWSPEWFVDDDGSVYIIAAKADRISFGSYDGTTAKMGYHVFKANDPGTFHSWSYVGKLTGSVFPVDAGGDHNMIDPFMFKRDGTYYVLWKSENVGDPGGLIAYATLGMASATSILGPYNSGGAFTPTTKGEGQNLFEMPAGSAYRWRIHFDNTPGKMPGGYQQYVETNDLSTVTAPVDEGLTTFNRHTTWVVGF